MDFMLDDGAFVESSINCPTKGNLHISDLQLSYLSLSLSLSSVSQWNADLQKMDDNIFCRRSDHFTKLVYSKCFLKISIKAMLRSFMKFHEYPIFKGSNFEQF